jgi:cytochrome c biogenesis protein CcdA/glutaredoxin
MKKLLFIFVLSLFSFSWYLSAQEYIYFYWNWCSHCAKVEKFFDENDILSKYNVQKKEIYFNRDNLTQFSDYIKKLWIDQNKAWVPFLVIESENECDYVAWDKKIIWFFQEKISQDDAKICSEWEDCVHFECNDENCPHLNCGAIDDKDISGNIWSENSDLSSKTNRLKFFAIMLPAALADSINPCAFAVMLLLLSSILTKSGSRKKAILSWLLFALAVFISYFAMWLWLFSALATSQNTFVLKIVVWLLWIIVWLANLKDYFRYGKWFIMEVPLSWRPNMQKIIKRAVSPLWAFVVWFLVSLFLLPCTSWPYFTILGYLASESSNLHTRWYIYLIVYNLIFILPMIAIALLVWLWFKSAEELASLKKKNTKLIHLIVGLLMLWLWIYVILTM